MSEIKILAELQLRKNLFLVSSLVPAGLLAVLGIPQCEDIWYYSLLCFHMGFL